MKYKNLKLVGVNESTTVFARRVEKGKWILFGLTHGKNPKIIGLTVPSKIDDLVFHRYLTKAEARRLK